MGHNGGMPTIPQSLAHDLQAAGYYPQLAAEMLSESLFGEPVVSHLVHLDTHVDLDSIHRHITAFVLTPTRLLLTHVDDEPQAVLGRMPRGVTATEDIPLARMRTMLISRTYDNPADYQPGDRPVEVALTLGWEAMRRLDVVPETCGDPECEGDHGYSGSVYPEDVTLRISAQAEGQPAVDQAVEFALRLRRQVFEARRSQGLGGL